MTAKKLFTTYGKHSNVVTYEYRGMTYDVEYSKDWSYLVTSPRVQHEDAQAKIDKMLDEESKPKQAHPFEISDLDEIFNWSAFD